jgi:cephalosporin hydroxylase
LWNIGADFVVEHCPDVTKFLFVDLDTYPVPGEEDWLVVVSKALDYTEVLHPWSTVTETERERAWMSFSAQTRCGVKVCGSGQGFAVAMTRDWYRRSGGWPEDAVAGSGDAIAVMRWDSGALHVQTFYQAYTHMQKLVTEYKGPKTEFGYCGGELEHYWHGARSGPGQTRNYTMRHRIWELCGGPDEVLEKDTNRLWKWKDSVKARAVRDVVRRSLSTTAETDAAFAEAMSGEGQLRILNETKHIPHTYTGIWGWFDFGDCYSFLVRECPDTGVMVEVGVFFGKSTCYLAVEVANSGKNIKVVAIDTFARLDATASVFVDDKVPYPESGTGYEECLLNLRNSGCGEVVELVKGDGHEAVTRFADSSIFSAFIDADHTYESTLAFLNEYWPKITSPGYLGGHDYVNTAYPGIKTAVDEWALVKGIKIETIGTSFLLKKE